MQRPISFPISAMAMLFLAWATPFNSYGQESPGSFSGNADVGNPSRAGSVQYDPETQTYVVEGSGENMWFDRDAFHFLWKRLEGDFILRAHVAFASEGGNPHRKIGWTVRHSLEPNTPHVSAAVHGDGLAAMQFRRHPGGMTEEVKSEVSVPDVIQLERKGNTYTMSVAVFGQLFESEQIDGILLGDDVYVGLFVCAHDDEALEKAVFSNVRIVMPVPDDYVPYQDYLGSRLEVMDVETGLRTVLYTSPKSLQAPNWTLDGKALIYNSEGLLYRFDLETRQPTVINTGFADRHNNDHVLSFDGKMLGISHHSAEDDGQSIIYTVPVGGGEPQRVTKLGPSYLHGWSPDGKFLVYTGGRNGQYDIYKIPRKGGKEIQLTDTPGLDDGPEYSPDGKYIYFNSNRTGVMQLWRMKPDGSVPEQLTFDEYHDWFPHISPDGKWIVFLTFPKEVDSGDHPFYKRVYLRMMPAGGGEPRVIAYVYGGQGTINVPSWSPDGKRIAFVSNTSRSE